MENEMDLGNANLYWGLAIVGIAALIYKLYIVFKKDKV